MDAGRGADDPRFALVAERRRSLAAFLRTLPVDRWRAPSLCAGWTVREVAGHLVTPLLMSTPRFAWEIVRCGGSFDRASDRVAHRYARLMDTEVLTDLIEDGAEDRFTPPGFGAEAPLADSVIHTLDVRWSLDAREPVPPAAAASATLDFLVSGKARVWSPKGLADGLAWSADDLDWSSGPAGAPAVTGPADALLVVLSGRRAGLDELSGPGAAQVKARLAR